MSARRHIIFLINLVQDVNMIRPLAYLAALELDVSIAFLVSGKFLERDGLRIWQRELGQICADVGGDIHIYETAIDAIAVLQRKGGIIIAASESDLPAHVETHNVFRVAPSTFLKVTLQHGYECVGFLQNKEHIIAHGRNIKFGADVICGWCAEASLTSLAATEKPKLYVSGAPTVLNIIPPVAGVPSQSGGLVCENLHSVRLRATGDFGKTFMDQFSQFCARLEEFGQGVSLRPHPGGMYVIKNKIALPRNVTLNSQPIYKIDLSRYGFGISAPSSVVLDMVLASIPVAVWRDEDGIMDASNYDGLTQISTLADWFGFARDTVLRREAILERQQEFLERIAMPTDRRDVYRRFATLLANGSARLGEISTGGVQTSREAMPRRILFVSDKRDPSLEAALLRPLAPLFAAGQIGHQVIIEAEVKLSPSQFGERLRAFDPDLIVCGRYSGSWTDSIVAYTKDLDVPLVCHVDGDPLDLPPEGDHDKRQASVTRLLNGAALVSCATSRLKSRLRQLGFRGVMESPPIHVSGEILVAAETRPITRIGYCAGDGGELRSILPQVIRFLRRNTEVSLDLFGAAPRPDELREFGGRVQAIAPPTEEILLANTIAERQWDIGLCPPCDGLAADSRWITHTCAGAATVAAAGSIHDAYCAEGSGVLVGDDGWVEGLEHLMDNPEERHQMVRRAQQHVEDRFSAARHRAQILAMFGRARSLMRPVADERWPHEQFGTLAIAAQPAVKRMGLQ